MKQVIDGKVYNTDTAYEIGEVCSGESIGDFGSWYGSLYKTKNGRFFIDGSGGPMTMFAVHSGNSSSGSTGIIVLSDDDARSIAEKDMEADVIEKFFTVEEG